MTPGPQRLLLVSGDGHWGALPEMYRDYLEQRYHADLDQLVIDSARMVEGLSETRHSPETLAIIDRQEAIQSGGHDGGWELDRRLRELDREGVAGEVLLSGHQFAMQPFFSVSSPACSAELRAAGARAYHRQLADVMADADGRLYGVADPGPCHDMDETLRELRWVAEHGFVSVTPPLGVLDPTLPPLSDDHYEPFWAACVDLGLTLSAHSGYGRPQSDGSGTAASLARLKEIEAKSREQGDVKWDEKVRAVQWEAGDPIPPGEDLRLRMSPDVRCDQMPAESVHRKALVLPRRLMWQLMLGGVFDRHPGLKLVMTNARADWVPTTLGYLDQLFAEGRLPVRERPSEYWQRHCAVAPSSLRPCEVELRKETGVRQLLFATDYPHPEGTWPNTHEWLRACLSGVPEDEARLILGENALSFYPRVDGEKLRAVARRIGPWPADILGDFTVDPQLVAEFHKCSGFSQAAEQLDAPYLDNLLAQDIQLLSTSAVSGRS